MGLEVTDAERKMCEHLRISDGNLKLQNKSLKTVVIKFLLLYSSCITT